MQTQEITLRHEVMPTGLQTTGPDLQQTLRNGLRFIVDQMQLRSVDEVAFVNTLVKTVIPEAYIREYIQMEEQIVSAAWNSNLRQLVTYFNYRQSGIHSPESPFIAKRSAATGVLYWYLLELTEDSFGVDSSPFNDKEDWREVLQHRDEIRSTINENVLKSAAALIDGTADSHSILRQDGGDELAVYALVAAICYLKVKPIMDALHPHPVA